MLGPGNIWSLIIIIVGLIVFAVGYFIILPRLCEMCKPKEDRPVGMPEPVDRGKVEPSDKATAGDKELPLKSAESSADKGGPPPDHPLPEATPKTGADPPAEPLEIGSL